MDNNGSEKTIEIREIRREDCVEVYAMMVHMLHLWKGPDRKVHGNPTAFEALIFDRKMAHAEVAVYDGKLVGFCFWTYGASSLNCMPSIWLVNFFVEPEYRRLGIGTAMYRYMQQKSRDLDTLGLEVFGNIDATEIEFFDSVGKRPDGQPRLVYHWNNGNHAPGCTARDTETVIIPGHDNS